MSAQRILDSLDTPISAEEISVKTGFPLFRVRSALREMVAAGLVADSGRDYGRIDLRTKRPITE